ncbi:tubulin monoglycylase TTLL3-like isoform X2 [Trichomycterus rosablanca]
MVRKVPTNFYWTVKTRSNHAETTSKKLITSHFEKSGAITTKAGLCNSLRNLHWFDAADPDIFFPRCYNLETENEKRAFIEDFRKTACVSLLQFIVERENENGQKNGSIVHQARTKIPSKVIDTALKVCQDVLDTYEHKDIDNVYDFTLTEEQWSEFLHNYYLAVQKGAKIEDSAHYMESCQAMLDRLREFSPQLKIDGTQNLWIIKPAAMSRGRGIMCSKQLDEILKMVHNKKESNRLVVQKYIERPLLIHGTKFDIRQWFLVTNWNPLTVWFYNNCYLRFSTQPYSLDKLDRSVHLCNNSIQKHFNPSELLHPEIPKESMWCCHQFQSFLSSQGKADQWRSTVIPGMKNAIIHALKTAQDQVQARNGSFELYGADFMLGEDLCPWLIEINSSPAMDPSTSVTAKLCAEVLEDTLRVVLDRKENKRAHTGAFELIHKQDEIKMPLYRGINILINGAGIKQPSPPLKKPSSMAKHNLSPSRNITQVQKGMKSESAEERASFLPKQRNKVPVKQTTKIYQKPASDFTVSPVKMCANPVYGRRLKPHVPTTLREQLLVEENTAAVKIPSPPPKRCVTEPRLTSSLTSSLTVTQLHQEKGAAVKMTGLSSEHCMNKVVHQATSSDNKTESERSVLPAKFCGAQSTVPNAYRRRLKHQVPLRQHQSGAGKIPCPPPKRCLLELPSTTSRTDTLRQYHSGIQHLTAAIIPCPPPKCCNRMLNEKATISYINTASWMSESKTVLKGHKT